MKIQLCPICHSKVEYSSRYPNYLCADCSTRVTAKNGKPLSFFNIDMSGGFIAEYKENRESYREEDGHICFVDGIKCWAEEAYMGGIVIESYFPLICSGFSAIESNLRRIKTKLEASREKLLSLINKDAFDIFYSIKFEKIGLDPLGSGFKSENLIEQINQTFTSIVTFLGIRYLMNIYGEQIYFLNVQTSGGFDMHNKDRTIIAEVFASVSSKNNKKLKTEIAKLLNEDSPAKYIFYYTHENMQRSETVKNNVRLINFSKKELEDALANL